MHTTEFIAQNGGRPDLRDPPLRVLNPNPRAHKTHCTPDPQLRRIGWGHGHQNSTGRGGWEFTIFCGHQVGLELKAMSAWLEGLEGPRDRFAENLNGPLGITPSCQLLSLESEMRLPCLICHSDRGSQYAAGTYVDYLAAIGATPSMSRTGNCYDNAPMERFFHTLKVELVDQCRWATQEARQALFEYTEGYCNRHRIRSALGYLTPEQTEQSMTG